MQVSQEKLLQYIHFNRQYNTLLIDHNTKLIEHNSKLINQLRTEMDTVTETSSQLGVESAQPQSGQSKSKITFTLALSLAGAEVMLVRKEVDNPTTTTTTTLPPALVKVLVRKEVGNPTNYFDKTFAEYQEGFSANGLLKKQSIQILTKSFRRELAWP